jgi:hypothetical protein
LTWLEQTTNCGMRQRRELSYRIIISVIRGGDPALYYLKGSVSVKKFTLPEALEVAKRLGIDFDEVEFTPEEFKEGMNIELEHGTVDPDTNVTNDDPLITGKIALAHLNEIGYYYHDDIGLEAWEHAIKAFKGDPKGKKIQIV